MQKFPSASQMDTAWRFVRDKLFYPSSGLIYDHAVKDRAEEFPSPEEIRRGYPNPCGYTTGMDPRRHHAGCMSVPICENR